MKNAFYLHKEFIRSTWQEHGYLWRSIKIYIKKSWHLHEERKKTTWEKYERSVDLYEESIRTRKRDHEIYLKIALDLHVKDQIYNRASVRDEESMKSTKRDQEIYMLRAWDLHEQRLRSSWTYH